MEQERDQEIEVTVKLNMKDLVKPSGGETSTYKPGLTEILATFLLLLFLLTNCKSGTTNNVEINGDGAKVEVSN